MSLYKPSLEMLIDSVNRLNNLTLRVQDYTFSNLTAIPNPTGRINTNITITALPNTKYAGPVTVGYERLELSSLEAQVDLTVPVHDITSSSQILEALNKRFGTVFTSGDIATRTLTAEERTIPGEIVLTAAASSLGWIGSMTVKTRLGGYKLAEHLVNTSLSGMNYPSPITTRPYAHMYSYWRDFTAAWDDLSQVEVGTAHLSELLAGIRLVTGDDWRLDVGGRYSLLDAVVKERVFIPTDTSERFNVNYEWALVVSLDAAASLGLAGDLVIQFNEPING